MFRRSYSAGLCRWTDESLESAYSLPCLPYKTPRPTGMGHLFKEVDFTRSFPLIFFLGGGGYFELVSRSRTFSRLGCCRGRAFRRKALKLPQTTTPKPWYVPLVLFTI